MGKLSRISEARYSGQLLQIMAFIEDNLIMFLVFAQDF